MNSQLLLPMNDPDRYFVAAARVRSACKVVAAELGHKKVAELWGCNESSVGLKLDEKNRNSIHPHEMLALKVADHRGLIRAAEETALRPAVTDEMRIRRLSGVLRRYLADEMAQLIERELEGL
jgi:hypothetical protein